MSTCDEEARALDDVWEFLLQLSSGEYKVTTITKLRADARRLVRHYPLAAGARWMKTQGGGRG